MSYSCTISFKQIEAEDVYDFLISFKKCVIEHINDIAEDNFIFSPISKHDDKDYARMNDLEFYTKETAMIEKTENWAMRSVFHYRYFYDKEHKLLGVFGVSKCCQDIFDNTIYFQNSYDQDYEYDEWKNIDIFEQIVNKYKQMSYEDIKNIYNKDLDEDSYFSFDNEYKNYNEEEKLEKIEYWRKSYIYEQIWSMFEKYLYDEDSVVYLSLFGYYDFEVKRSFVMAVKHKYMEWKDKNDI